VTFGTVIVLSLVAGAVTPGFRTLTNINDILRQAVGLGLASVGQTLVILLGGIDLSVGSVAKLSEMIAAIIMNGNTPMIVPAMGVALGIGLLAGGVNGLLVTRLRIAPFIATFGMFGLLQGIAFLISTSPVGQAAPPVVTAYDAQTGPVHTVVVAFAILLILTWLFLARTPPGRHIYALGADVQVARLAGIRLPRGPRWDRGHRRSGGAGGPSLRSHRRVAADHGRLDPPPDSCQASAPPRCSAGSDR
jgi:ribose/xylose/arabinose/galactoside ABC-type transport system permease subunit